MWWPMPSHDAPIEKTFEITKFEIVFAYLSFFLWVGECYVTHVAVYKVLRGLRTFSHPRPLLNKVLAVNSTVISLFDM